MTDSFAVPRSQWVQDDEVSSCMCCNGPFLRTLFKSGKHHCRRCGKVVCRKCREYKIKRKGKTYPVCSVCFEQFNRDVDNIEGNADVPCLSPMNSLDSCCSNLGERDSGCQQSSLLPEPSTTNDSLSVHDETCNDDAIANEMVPEGGHADCNRDSDIPEATHELLLPAQSDEQVEQTVVPSKDAATMDTGQETETSDQRAHTSKMGAIGSCDEDAVCKDEAHMSIWWLLLLGAMFVAAMYFGITLRTNMRMRYCDSEPFNANATNGTLDEECQPCPQNTVCMNGESGQRYYASVICTVCALVAVFMFVTRSSAPKTNDTHMRRIIESTS